MEWVALMVREVATGGAALIYLNVGIYNKRKKRRSLLLKGFLPLSQFHARSFILVTFELPFLKHP